MNPHGYFPAGRPSTVVRKPPAPQPEAPRKRQGFLSKAISYAKAEASMIVRGPLDDSEYAARIAHCLECKHLDKPAGHDRVGWCGACGCGRKVRAELTIKGRMPKATCPKGKWPAVQ